MDVLFPQLVNRVIFFKPQLQLLGVELHETAFATHLVNRHNIAGLKVRNQICRLRGRNNLATFFRGRLDHARQFGYGGRMQTQFRLIDNDGRWQRGLEKQHGQCEETYGAVRQISNAIDVFRMLADPKQPHQSIVVGLQEEIAEIGGYRLDGTHNQVVRQRMPFPDAVEICRHILTLGIEPEPVVLYMRRMRERRIGTGVVGYTISFKPEENILFPHLKLLKPLFKFRE